MFDERYLNDLGPFFDWIDRTLQQARHDLDEGPSEFRSDALKSLIAEGMPLLAQRD